MKLLYSIEDRQAPFVSAFMNSAVSHGFIPRLIVPTSDESPSFTKFRQVYRHLSINPESFELACFRRYFEIARLAPQGETFIIADSDLLINADASTIPELFTDKTNTLIGSVGCSNKILERDISPHFSFWNLALVNQFIDYLINVYESQASRLQHIYTGRQEAGNKRAAISDMTLLHMFVHDMSVPFINSNQVVDGMLIDHNFSMAECDNSVFRKECGFKAFRRKQGSIRFITTDGKVVYPLAIHLQGRAKMAAQSLAYGHDIEARVRLGSLSVARQVRHFFS